MGFIIVPIIACVSRQIVVTGVQAFFVRSPIAILDGPMPIAVIDRFDAVVIIICEILRRIIGLEKLEFRLVHFRGIHPEIAAEGDDMPRTFFRTDSV